MPPRLWRRLRQLGAEARYTWRKEGFVSFVAKGTRGLVRLSAAALGGRSAAPPTAPADEDYLYQRWRAAHDPDATQLRQQRAAAGLFAYRPLISFITPVYN